ncbi:TAF14 Transcription initiation factor TFIID subunit 14 [Candida maltosa Xu316]|uniref:Transcription initiation factor TFIID subunit 14 n=1 Tax=Candida maltosa (strain Xu316) TaxID=1245528 RepID=M3JF21_CANMX|nr:Transcription initiation factor TFIID subunit 14 [Candida maltosa Xu316]
MSEVKRTIRITTEQHIMTDVPPVENYPMRQWSIQISMLDAQGKEHPAKILDKVTYTLHPTFPNPIRTLKQQPFKVEEKGWGEFDIPIAIHILGLGKNGERKFQHDLNFLQEKYVNDHVISIPVSPTKNGALNKILTETGSLPFDESGASTAAVAAAAGGVKRKLDTTNGAATPASVVDNKAKKAKGAVKGNIDLEKLSQGLTKLSEDDLIVIVQMVTDNRTNEMNIKNDVDNGEFTMDLFTFPESLLKSLWDYVKKHTGEA